MIEVNASTAFAALFLFRLITVISDHRSVKFAIAFSLGCSTDERYQNFWLT